MNNHELDVDALDLIFSNEKTERTLQMLESMSRGSIPSHALIIAARDEMVNARNTVVKESTPSTPIL